MTAAHLLAELRLLDVHVILDGDLLRLNAPAGVLTDEHKHDLAQHKSEIIAFLREAQQIAAQQPAIVPLEARGTRVPIFAVAGHNGDVFTYRVLARHLGSDQPFYGLQPPGLEDGSEPLTRLEDLAGYFAEQIREFQPAGPMSVAGYCAGGSVAFELARQLSESGAQISNLILFGAPFCKSYRPWGWTMGAADYLATHSATHSRALRAMPMSGRPRYVSDRMRKLLQHRAEKTSDPVLIRRGAVEKATMAAARAYSPLPSGCHLDLMIPCESWKRSWALPLRWCRLAVSATEFVGPDDCTTDTMLLPEYATAFSTFVAEAQRRHSPDLPA